MKNLHIALSLAVLAATFAGPSAQAQRRGFASAPAGRGGAAFARGRSARTGVARRGRARGFFQGSAYNPYLYPAYGYASDFGYGSDLNFDSAYEPTLEAPPPQIVFREPYRAAPPQPSKPSEGPVLLELQGDHWLRITSNGSSQIAGPSEPEQASNLPTAAASAVLVFRDGHKEEIGKYCIMGATIRIGTNYWTTGSWTRAVQISDLDVPATLKLNEERGSHFRLPSGPYEVMIGE